ncbi:MAG: hypothetical protein ACYTXA_07715 [Nostoc sp.]
MVRRRIARTSLRDAARSWLPEGYGKPPRLRSAQVSNHHRHCPLKPLHEIITIPRSIVGDR